jgi:hypothetical protein
MVVLSLCVSLCSLCSLWLNAMHHIKTRCIASLKFVGKSEEFHARSMIGHFRSMIEHSRSMIGHSRRVFGHSRSMIGHSRSMIGHSRRVIGHSRSMIGHSPSMIGHSPSMKFLTSDEDLSFGNEKSRATENKIPARDVNTDILSGEFISFLNFISTP